MFGGIVGALLPAMQQVAAQNQIPQQTGGTGVLGGRVAPQDPGQIYLQGTGGYNGKPFTMADLVRNDLITDPSYQFRFGEGQRAIENRGAAMGKRFSGNMLRALTDYGQDLASTEFSNAYNRLAGISGTAQTATSQMNEGGQALAGQIGDSAAASGNARANAAMAGGMANAGMWNNLGQAGSTLLNNMQTTGNIFGASGTGSWLKPW
jgi:hypothetical protein